MFTEQDHAWMQLALQHAREAETCGEVPVGAVLVLENQLIGAGNNRPISTSDPTAHAEIIALRQGSEAVQNYRLLQTTLYVTLEPCLMCLGAITHARVQRVVYGASDPKSGAVVSAFQLGETTKLNHRVQYQGGLLAAECGHLLTEFFRAKRAS